LIALAVLAFVLFNPFTTAHTKDPPNLHDISSYEPIRPAPSPSDNHRPDPIRWLHENSNNKHAVSESIFPHLPSFGTGRRPRAAIISLARNAELLGMMQSIRQLEYRWNSKYQVRFFVSIDPSLLTLKSTLGSSSMTNHLRMSSKQEHRTQLRPNVTMRLSPKNTGRFPSGSTRVDS
jgi:hypothetical protein